MKSFIKEALYVLFRQIKGPQRKERTLYREVGPPGTGLSAKDMEDDEKIREYIIFVVKDKKKFEKRFVDLLTQKTYWEKYVVPVLEVLGPLLAIIAGILALV